MNPSVEFNLTLILFLPWFAILGALFWFYPREPRTAARRGFDLAVLILAMLTSWLAMRWGMLNADANAGAIWKQVLACLTAYGAFLAVLIGAWFLRARLLAPHRS